MEEENCQLGLPSGKGPSASELGDSASPVLPLCLTAVSQPQGHLSVLGTRGL